MPPPNQPSPASSCPICGSYLNDDFLAGNCPACLLAEIISDEVDEHEARGFPSIDGYEVLEEIGHGGMGIVYRAQQERPFREVALKIVNPHSLRASEARARFLLEIDAMAAVEHPGILPLYDAGEDRFGRPWLSMQLANPKSLADRIPDYREDWRKITSLLVQLCGAMYFAHQRGILHRDLKPANILFDANHNPYIADFGLAKWADEDASLTRSSILLGSPIYLAPEAAREGSKATTTVSDVYGLGAIFYELLSGKKPYEGKLAAEVITQIISRAPLRPRQHLPKVPRDLEVIVLKAMARIPEKRYHSPAAFADDLQRWLDGKPIHARPVGLLEKGLIWARRNPALTALSLLLIASLMTGGILLWRANQDLQNSLEDVEGRVEFMTRELPARLEPLGRLDLLDGVFANLSEYYGRDTRTDAESLARHSDFFTQWSQIARDRGETDTMIERLELALAKAEEAIAKGQPNIAADRARIAAGWRLGETLLFSYNGHDGITPERIQQARSILLSTKNFAETVTTEDWQIQVLKAHLEVEWIILETHAGEIGKAIAHGEKAKNLWAKAMPALAEHSTSALGQQALKQSADVHYFLLTAHHLKGNHQDEKDSLLAWVNARRELSERYPENVRFAHLYAAARKSQASRSMDQPAHALQILEKVNQDYDFLLSLDPTNIHWLTEAITVARLLADCTDALADQESRAKWMKLLAERLHFSYRLGPSHSLKVLTMHREDAAYCGIFYLSHDWLEASTHFTGATKVQVRIVELSGDDSEKERLARMTQRMKTFFLEHENEAAFESWLKHNPSFQSS